MGSDNYLYDAVYGSANAHKISADRLKELYIKGCFVIDQYDNILKPYKFYETDNNAVIVVLGDQTSVDGNAVPVVYGLLSEDK